MNEFQRLLAIAHKKKKDVQKIRQSFTSISYDVVGAYFAGLQYSEEQKASLREEFSKNNIFVENTNNPSAEDFKNLLLCDLNLSAFDTDKLREFFNCSELTQEQKNFILTESKKNSVNLSADEKITFDVFYKAFLKSKSSPAQVVSKIKSYNFVKETTDEDFQRFWKQFFSVKDDNDSKCWLCFNEHDLNSYFRNFPNFLSSLFKIISSNEHNRVYIIINTQSSSEDTSKNQAITEALLSLMPLIYEKHAHLILTNRINFNKSIILFPKKSVIFVDSLLSQTHLYVTKNDNTNIISEKEELLNNIFSTEETCFSRSNPINSRWVSIELSKLFSSKYQTIRCISDGYPVYVNNTDNYRQAFFRSDDPFFDISENDYIGFENFLKTETNSYKEINLVRRNISPHFYFRDEPSKIDKLKAEKITLKSISKLKLEFKNTYEIKFFYDGNNHDIPVSDKLFKSGCMYITNDEIIIRYHYDEAQALCRDKRVLEAAKHYFKSLYRELK